MSSLVTGVSAWLSNLASSRNVQLAGTAVVSASAAAAAVLAYQSLSHEERARTLKADIPPLPQSPIMNKVGTLAYMHEGSTD